MKWFWPKLWLSFGEWGWNTVSWNQLLNFPNWSSWQWWKATATLLPSTVTTRWVLTHFNRLMVHTQVTGVMILKIIKQILLQIIKSHTIISLWKYYVYFHHKNFRDYKAGKHICLVVTRCCLQCQIGTAQSRTYKQLRLAPTPFCLLI